MTQKKFAYFLSRFLGPTVMLVLIWLVTALKSGIGVEKALWVYPLIFIVGIAVPALITSWWVFKGKVKDIEWSDVRERHLVIPLLLVCGPLVLLLTYFLTNTTVFHLSLLASALALVTVSIWRFSGFKISAHISIATGTFWGINFLTHLEFWWLFLLLIPLIWARYTLKAHSLSELLAALFISNGLIVLALLIFGFPTVR